MKNWFLIPLAAIAGLIAGSWGPREDLALMKESGETAKAKAETSRRSGFGAIAEFANVPARARTSRLAPPAPATTGRVDAAGVASAPTNRPAARQPRQRLSPEDLRARIDEAAELWRTRGELAKTQWKSKLGVSGDAEARFDDAVTAMNAALRETMVAFANDIVIEKELSPELGAKLMSAMTGTIADSYDAIAESVDPSRRKDVSQLPLHEFIDPSVLEPMIQVQDLIEPGSLNFGR